MALSQMAEELGASAVMVTPSKEGVPLTDDRMLEYYGKVGQQIFSLCLLSTQH